MTHAPTAVRPLALAAVLLAAPVAAQASLRVVDPSLSVDGARVAAIGQPEGRGVLAIAVPGRGTYLVSDVPFGAARRVGEFNDRLLVFAVDGTSVRLVSRDPIREGAPAPAYALFEPAAGQPQRGPARLAFAEAPRTAFRAPRGPAPGATPRASADEARLRAEIDRLTDERARLAADRDRLLAGAGLQTRGSVPDARLVAARDAASAERDRLLAERDQLAAARDRALADRAEFAARLIAVRRELDAARSARDVRTASSEADALRTQIVARDAALDALRAEGQDRTARLAAVEADLAATRLALAEALAQRDAALADRDVLAAERDRLAAERDAAFRERDAALAELEARVRAERPLPASDNERRALAERDALQAERDALALQLEALRAERERLVGWTAAPPATPSPVSTPSTAPSAAEAVPRRAGSVALPGFDFGRLRNADTVRRRMSGIPPERAGEVLVLFQTDASGRVIRTAVPMPVGGGLDAAAEEIVREMRFVPPVVDGQPTGLRSQVVVRFEP